MSVKKIVKRAHVAKEIIKRAKSSERRAIDTHESDLNYKRKEGKKITKEDYKVGAAILGHTEMKKRGARRK